MEQAFVYVQQRSSEPLHVQTPILHLCFALAKCEAAFFSRVALLTSFSLCMFLETVAVALCTTEVLYFLGVM